MLVKWAPGHLQYRQLGAGWLRLSTHFPLDKMAAILADDIFKCIFLNKNDRIPIRIDNNPALI